MADVENITSGSTYELPANGFTAPDGKQFKCWSVGGEEKTVGTEITITANTTVKAVWEDIPVSTHTITVNNGTSTPTTEAEENTTVTITAGEAPSGKEFEGWEVVSGGITLADETSATTTFIMGTANVEVTAKYKDIVVTPVTHTITVNNGTSTPTTEAEENTTVTITAGEAPSGKEFEGWEVVSGGITLADETSATTTFIMGTANVEVTAKYKDIVVTPTTYTVTFNTNGGSNVEAQTVNDGETASKPTNPTKSGYTFKEWQKDGVTFDFTTAITGDIELKAVWTKNETKPTSGGGGGSSSSSYKVTTKIENGTITPANTSVKKNADQEFTFKVNQGYEITDVLVDGKSVGAVETYKLEKVTSKHTIEVKTAKKSILSNVDDWAKEEMAKAEENGLIPETFAKKDATKAISRLDFAAVAVKLYETISGKKAEPVANNPFTDTNDTYVLKAYALGITLGTSETTFTPNSEITREQMATMLTRALNKAGIDTKVDLENATKFADDSDLNDWGRESVYFMAGKEIIKGVGDNRFNGLGNAKIEEAIAIALRSVEVYSK